MKRTNRQERKIAKKLIGKEKWLKKQQEKRKKKINNIKEFYYEYANNYLKLSTLRKYNCYHILLSELDKFIKKHKEYQNILLVHQQPNDIDYLAILSNKYDNIYFFMSGIQFTKFSRKFYFNRIYNTYKDFEFASMAYQPTIEEKELEQLNDKFKNIDLIILPSKIADVSKESIYLYDKKLIKFLKKFNNAKILGIGFDFSLTNKNTKKLKNYAIHFDDYISVKANEHFRPERED